MFLVNKIILNRIIVFFIAAMIMVSCKSNFAVLNIENARPASDELPSDIQSLTLMNRSMNNQFDNYREDSLQKYFYRKGYQLSKIILDSAASDTTIRALAALLFESGRYDVVVPLKRNMNRYLPYEMLPDTLTPERVKTICADYNTDALLVLERFSTKAMADYTSEKHLSAGNGTNTDYYASLDLKYDAFFRIYKPNSKTLLKEIEVIDTINWESSDYTQERLFRKLPSIKQAMFNAGIKIALDLDQKLSPTWIPEKRGYFLFQSKDDRGQQLMNENNYEEAGKYWNEMAQSTNKKVKSKAEFNLALISELNGDLDGAIELGLKSFYTYYRFQAETYLKKLKIRRETLLKTK
ncbi:MAG: DUF6340 family protein [Bacteroidia bacterium]|jgi:Family of unknown function (DUF6340)